MAAKKPAMPMGKKAMAKHMKGKEEKMEGMMGYKGGGKVKKSKAC